MEAPDDRILVGPIPSELNITDEINSTYPDGELSIPQYSDNSSSYCPWIRKFYMDTVRFAILDHRIPKDPRYI